MPRCNCHLLEKKRTGTFIHTAFPAKDIKGSLFHDIFWKAGSGVCTKNISGNNNYAGFIPVFKRKMNPAFS